MYTQNSLHDEDHQVDVLRRLEGEVRGGDLFPDLHGLAHLHGDDELKGDAEQLLLGRDVLVGVDPTVVAAEVAEGKGGERRAVRDEPLLEDVELILRVSDCGGHVGRGGNGMCGGRGRQM